MKLCFLFLLNFIDIRRPTFDARRFIFSLLVFLLPAFPLLSQDCDDNWAIEVCDQPFAAVDATCLDQTDACSQRYFYVYMVHVGNQLPNGSDEAFTFLNFSFSGKLNISPTTGMVMLSNPNNATQLGHSHLNEKKSKECSPYLPGTGISEINEEANTFAWHYSNDDGSPITWGVDGRRLLFVIAVDGYPDEGFYPNDMAGSFVWLETVQGGGVVPHICNASVTVCTEPLYKSVSSSEECTAPLQFKFGSFVADPITGYPNRVKTPVYATSDANSPVTYNTLELNLLITLLNTQPMGLVSLEPGNVSLQDVKLYKEPPLNQSTNQRIYLETKELSLTTFNTTPNTDNILFYIVVNGPALASSCATTTLTFTDYRRMVLDGSSQTCCIPGAGGERTYEWGASPCISNCNSSTLTAAPLPTFPANADQCHDLFFHLLGSSTASPLPQYRGADIILDVHHSGTLALSNTGASPTSSTLCSSCITATAISADVLRVTLSFSSGLFELGSPAAELAVFKFTGEGACINKVTFYDATLIKKDGMDTPCQPNVVTEIADGTDDDICSYLLSFCTYMWFDQSQGMNAETDVNYSIIAANDPTCNLSGIFKGCGSNFRCVCNTEEQQLFVPSCNLDVLNGVTTWDLVKISRHILGLEPLSSPFKIIAADANNSGTVTTTDIVELRKLILGTYTTLPENKSYRFLENTISFPVPANPWNSTYSGFGIHNNYVINPSFPEEAKFFSVPPGGLSAEFKAIKIGDVSNDVIFFTSTEDRAVAPVGYAHSGGKKGQRITMPFFAKTEIHIEGWQAAIQFNPELVRIKKVDWAKNETAEYEPSNSSGDWNVPIPGELRLSWLSMSAIPMYVLQGTPLVWIEVELLEDLPADAPLFSAGAGISSELYTTSGTAQYITFVQEKEYTPPVIKSILPADWTFNIYPNPSNGAFRLNFDLPESSKVNITVFDTTGTTVATLKKTFASGIQSLTSNQFPALAAGQYAVQVQTPWGIKTLKLVYSPK